jgi:hypothetical protein
MSMEIPLWSEVMTDSGHQDQWFLVRQGLKLGLGLRVGWHYTRAQLLEREPVDAPDPVTGRAMLAGFMADPAYLLPVADNWSMWTSPLWTSKL